MTFQRWWEAGKVARLREFGLWSIDPPGYYGDDGPGMDRAAAGKLRDIGVTPYGQAGTASKFLTYENGVLDFVSEYERQRGAPVVLFEKNWLGLAYQLAALRCVGWSWDTRPRGRRAGAPAVRLQLHHAWGCQQPRRCRGGVIRSNMAAVHLRPPPMPCPAARSACMPAGMRWRQDACWAVRLCCRRCGAGAITMSRRASWRHAPTRECAREGDAWLQFRHEGWSSREVDGPEGWCQSGMLPNTSMPSADTLPPSIACTPFW